MTPEMLFAKALAKVEEKHNEKLASGIDSLSVEELEEILLAKESTEEEKNASDGSVEDGFSNLCEMADQWGRELARQEYEKIAAILPPGGMTGAAQHVGGMVQQGVGKALNAAATTGAGKRMAVGAAAGAAAGAMKQTGYDPQTGRPQGRLGNMAMGAMAGAGAGHLAGPAAQHVMSMPGPVGQYAQQAAAAARIPRPMAPAMAGVAASPVTAPAAPSPMMAQPQPGMPAQGAPGAAQAAPEAKPAAKKPEAKKPAAKKSDKKPEKKKE